MSTYVENDIKIPQNLFEQFPLSNTHLKLTLNSCSTVHKLENDDQKFFEDLLFEFWGLIMSYKIDKDLNNFD